MRVRRKAISSLAAVGAIALVAASGSGCTKSNTSPSSTTGGSGGTPTSTTTITITSSGVSPKSIVVGRGAQVTFVNNSSVSHEMNSNPHPDHTDCPELNQVGFITSGQSKQTGNLNTARTCGYHDHGRDFDTSLQGTITIQ